MGEKRTVIELEVDEIGLSLRYTAIPPPPAGSRKVKGLPARTQRHKVR